MLGSTFISELFKTLPDDWPDPSNRTWILPIKLILSRYTYISNFSLQKAREMWLYGVVSGYACDYYLVHLLVDKNPPLLECSICKTKNEDGK